ncbi:hypothetical protein [Cystobacter ferrugineus]|uniref:Secreted protein n=1 Tax=Cystobacter ferrugineus TaxID=83449 RepID=A0A1L9B4L6_9BACT|nr:hypothetical protein [Cystobacter ferrugineus]OJH37197.1 hypothetical protein BON30_28170 [Cystobacter ferrugineus]
MRTLTFALVSLLALTFASRLSDRPTAHPDPVDAQPTDSSLSKGGGSGGKDGGSGGDDDDEDFQVVHA